MNPQAIGEAQINPQAMQQVAPDVSSPQGQQELTNKSQMAEQAKPQFDALLDRIAQKVGGSFSSRVKDIDTAAKKIAQKRLQGRDYDTEDINDMLGGRIVVTKDKFPAVKKAIEKLANKGAFEINESEPVTVGTYRAYHFDLSLPQGLDAELQIHTHQSEAESIANHDLRAIHGEKPQNKAVEVLRDKQAGLIKSLPNDKAKAVSDALQKLHKANNNQPIHPVITAQVLQQARGGGL